LVGPIGRGGHGRPFQPLPRAMTTEIVTSAGLGPTLTRPAGWRAPDAKEPTAEAVGSLVPGSIG